MKYSELLTFAEDWATTERKHLGAVLTQADKAYSRWRKAHKHPRRWQEALVRDWFTDEKLGKVTGGKALWRVYKQGEEDEV